MNLPDNERFFAMTVLAWCWKGTPTRDRLWTPDRKRRTGLSDDLWSRVWDDLLVVAQDVLEEEEDE